MNEQHPVKTLGDLARLAGGSIGWGGDTTISGIEYDSRLVKPGVMFVAMRGGYADGHDYIPQALERGASALLVEQPGDYPVPSIIVADSRAALSPVAAAFFDHPSRQLKVVGVTGTDGKTSTSTIAEAMFTEAGFKTGLIGTVQIKIGTDVVAHESRQTTPESLDIQRILRQMVDAGVEWAFLEATSHGLAMHRLDDVRFEIAAVTNITHEHIDFHGTREAYWAAKKRLFDMTTRLGGRSAVVNLDDPGARSTLDACAAEQTVTYSQSDSRAGIFADSISLSTNGFSAIFESPAGPIAITSPLLGGFNVSNSLCATGIALMAGIEPDVIARTLANPPVIAGRMARIEEGQSFNVVVDYAHTPASLEKVLTLLRSLDDRGRIIVVTGSAGERDREKRPLQGEVCARLADVSIFTNEDPRFEDAGAIIEEIAAGARNTGGRPGETFYEVEDRAEAIALAVSIADAGDTILLAGKGHERSIIVNGKKLPWDEAAVARRAIRNRIEQERER